MKSSELEPLRSRLTELGSFGESTLYISARSPFARRVRICFYEHKINFREVVLDVFKPQPELARLNPLVRVPTLELASGNVLIDSHQILEAFYRFHGDSLFLPGSESDYFLALKWSGIAIGLCDKVIEYFFETSRPLACRDQEWILECENSFTRVLEQFSIEIADRPSIADRITQADFDMVTALAYLSLRYSTKWQRECSNVDRYFRAFCERASFLKTMPPPLA